jgi:hypothetical protein
MMCGWMPLPGYIDKIRLHLAGKLHPDLPAEFWERLRWLLAEGSWQNARRDGQSRRKLDHRRGGL